MSKIGKWLEQRVTDGQSWSSLWCDKCFNYRIVCCRYSIEWLYMIQ